MLLIINNNFIVDYCKITMLLVNLWFLSIYYLNVLYLKIEVLLEFIIKILVILEFLFAQNKIRNLFAGTMYDIFSSLITRWF